MGPERQSAADLPPVTAVSEPSAIGKPILWVVSELYYPEETSTGYFLTQIAEGLAGDHDVRVLAGQPTYSARGTRAPSVEFHNGVHIRRCLGTSFDKDILLSKIINHMTMSLSVFWALLMGLRQGQQVLVVTNPPISTVIVAIACRLRRARCILLIHDVYPDAMIAAGLIRPDGRVAKSIGAAAKWLYRSVDRICVVGRDMERLIRARTANASITTIPNWAEPDLRPMTAREDNPLLQELGLAHKFVVQYAGNMGRVHDMETLFEVVARMGARSEPIHFVFIGAGARKRWLEEAVARAGLSNITILPNRPRRDQQTFLEACDIAITAFVPGMCGVGVPSRMYNILAVGKPIVAAVDAESEIALVVREERVGWIVPPRDVDGLVRSILDAFSHQDQLSEIARRGAEAATGRYSLERALHAYRRLIDDGSV